MFRIRWRKSVSHKLLDECSKADAALLDDILDAMAYVESILQNEPEFVGESRDVGKRCLIVDPISVIYKVDIRNRIVLVTRAWVHNSRK